MRALCKLSFEGFSRFLMDKDNYAFVNEHAKHDTTEVKQLFLFPSNGVFKVRSHCAFFG